ncbi:MAG: rRNA adenine N-6-methyltransferase family protein, partial [Thermomicrobiales bacterium]
SHTAAIVTRLTSAPWPPEDMHLVVQREAAYRVMGHGRESHFSLLLKPWFAPAITYAFRRADFTPQPRVDAVLLHLRKRGPPLVAPGDAPLFRASLPTPTRWRGQRCVCPWRGSLALASWLASARTSGSTSRRVRP